VGSNPIARSEQVEAPPASVPAGLLRAQLSVGPSDHRPCPVHPQTFPPQYPPARQKPVLPQRLGHGICSRPHSVGALAETSLPFAPAVRSRHTATCSGRGPRPAVRSHGRRLAPVIRNHTFDDTFDETFDGHAAAPPEKAAPAALLPLRLRRHDGAVPSVGSRLPAVVAAADPLAVLPQVCPALHCQGSGATGLTGRRTADRVCLLPRLTGPELLPIILVCPDRPVAAGRRTSGGSISIAAACRAFTTGVG
jgi:hypothetical protein